MKKILLPIISLLLIGLILTGCDLFGENKKLIYLDITVSPTDYEFSEGDNVKEHLKVEGFYSDESVETITDYGITTTTNSVTVNYESQTKTILINVRKTLKDIEIITNTDVFFVGQRIRDFITVQSIYSDDTKKIVTDYIVTPTDITSDTDSVTVTYTEGKITKEKEIPISVISGKTLNGIKVMVNSAKFYEGDDIKDYLTVKSIYSDNSEKTLPKESYSTDLQYNIVTSTTDSVTITVSETYTDGSITMTKIIPITVGLLSDFDISSNDWFNNVFSETNNKDVTLISFVKEKPSEVTQLVKKVGELFYYKNETALYIVGERKIAFPSNCSRMFFGFSNVEQIDLSNVDTSKVTNMNGMFLNCSKLTSLDLSKFDTSKVTDMRSMFYSCKSLTSLDLSSFDTSNVTKMDGMFYNCNSLKSIIFGNNFNTSIVTNMSIMFSGCSNLTSLDLSKFDTSKISDMSNMFIDCKSLTSLDLSSFDTSNVTKMDGMFNNCNSLKSITFGDNFNTSNVNNMKLMFDDCNNLTSLDLSKFNTSNVTDMWYMFSNCEELTELDLSSFDTSNVTEMTGMFDKCGKSGTTVTINPSYESFFNETELNSGWTYTSTTDLGTYTKI